MGTGQAQEAGIMCSEIEITVPRQWRRDQFPPNRRNITEIITLAQICPWVPDAIQLAQAATQLCYYSPWRGRCFGFPYKKSTQPIKSRALYGHIIVVQPFTIGSVAHPEQLPKVVEIRPIHATYLSLSAIHYLQCCAQHPDSLFPFGAWRLLQ